VHSRVDLPVRCDLRDLGRGVAASICAAVAARPGWLGSSGAAPSTGRAAGLRFMRRPFARPPQDTMCLSPRPGLPSAGTPRLSPRPPPSGEGTLAGIEQRAPEGVEVVPEALGSSSAATVLFRGGALPGFQAACEEPHSSARRVPPISFSKARRAHNNKAQVNLRKLLIKLRDLHIWRTEYPRLCPQLLFHICGYRPGFRAAFDAILKPIQAFGRDAGIRARLCIVATSPAPTASGSLRRTSALR
jgi:hypothetical protein